MRIESCRIGRAAGVYSAALVLIFCVLNAVRLQAESVTLAWDPNSEADLAGYYVYYGELGAPPTRLEAGLNTSLTVEDLVPGSTYVFYATAFNTANLESDPSDPVTYTVPEEDPGGDPGTEPPIFLVSNDVSTQGNWKGAYGDQGFQIAGHANQPASYASLEVSGASQWIWGEPSADLAALQKAYSSGRIASCWYGETFTMNFDWSGSSGRQLALYFLDWDVAGRVQQVEYTDTATGEVLHSTELSGFQDGVYLVCPFDRDLQVTITRVAGPNAVVSAAFYDDGTPAVAVAAQPVVTPPGGAFTNSVQVTIASSTPGAVIHYTLDGSTPDSTSTAYTAPITISANALLSARAYAEGYQPSAVTQAQFRFSTGGPGAAVTFAGRDETTQGAWSSSYGDLGFSIVADWTALPETVDLVLFGASEHIWKYQADNPSALEKFSDATAIAACWYSADEFELDLEVNAGPRRVSIYCLDWDEAGRSQSIEIYDGGTGDLLDAQTVEDFQEGIYLSWDIQGAVTIRVVNQGQPNAVISGIFVD